MVYLRVTDSWLRPT